MAAPPLVVICHLAGRLFPEVEAAVAEQHPSYARHVDQPHPLRTYADFVRLAWAGLGDLVIVEGDSIPPPGAIPGLLTCRELWCTHPSWVGDRYLDNTLGLVRFSLRLQRLIPDLAEQALTRPWARGNHWDRGLGMSPPERYLGAVPVEPSVAAVWPQLRQRSQELALAWGTTIHPKAIDMALNRVLEVNRISPHVHQPPAPHLRYLNDPAWASTPPASLQPYLEDRGRPARLE